MLLHIICALFLVQSVKSHKSQEETCLSYYANNFELENLIGEWYNVYLWPESQRKQEKCELISFSKVKLNENLKDCRNETESIQASYGNFGKVKIETYFGNAEVKYMYLSCERMFKVIFIKINDDYVLGINCSARGRGRLLSKKLPKNSDEVQNIVNSIDIMTGREGGFQCDFSS